MTIGKYRRPAGETAGQLRDALSDAIGDYRRFLRSVQQLYPCRGQEST